MGFSVSYDPRNNILKFVLRARKHPVCVYVIFSLMALIQYWATSWDVIDGHTGF